MTHQAYVDHRKRVCFFWSPKCASRSLTTWLFHTYVHPTSTALNHGRAVNRLFLYDFPTAAMLVCKHGYLGVAMIRHPARRIVSAFIDKFVAHGGTPLTRFQKLESFARTAVRDIAAMKGRPFRKRRYEGISFFDLLDFIEAQLRSSADGADLDMHWTPQVLELQREIGLQFDHVCAVESLSADFEPIRRLYRSRLPISVQNQSRRSKSPCSEDLTETPSLALTKIDFGYENFLTRAALDRIAQIYARDFAELGYDPYDLDRSPSIRARNRATVRRRSQDSLAKSWLRWRRQSWRVRKHLPQWDLATLRADLAPLAVRLWSRLERPQKYE